MPNAMDFSRQAEPVTTMAGSPDGLLAPGNIDLMARPVAHNPDGSISTVRSISIDEDGKSYLIPTVTPDGKVVSDSEAIDLFHRTGQHLGAFKNYQQADAYAQALHQQQAGVYDAKPATLDFSGQATPVETVGPGGMALRGLVKGGGALLKTLDSIGGAFDPSRAVNGALLDRTAQQQGVTGEALQHLHDAQDPLKALATHATDYGTLGPNEVSSGKLADFAGGVSEAVPQLAAAVASGGESALPELLPAGVKSVPVLGKLIGAILHGAPTAAALTTEQATNLPDTMSPADKLEATAKAAGVNTLLAGVPGAVGSNPLLRTATGGALGYGTSAAASALEGQPQDTTNNAVGAFIGALLGGAHPNAPATDPHLAQYAAAAEAAPAAGLTQALPRGADYSARAEPVRPAPADLGGAVHVDSAGSAATPAQGANAFAQAVAAGMGAQPTGLPEPVVRVDPAGNAATTADQHAALQPVAPAAPDPLGLSERLRALVAADPRSAREGAPIAPRALPAPVVAVDRRGQAMTTAQANAQQQALAARADERQALGITPDIERSQGVRWSKQDQATREEADRRAQLAALDDAIAAREAQNKPARGRNASPDETTDDALTFLAKAGGLDRRALVSEGLDPKVARAPENLTRGGASRPLFRALGAGGMSLDKAAETLWQHGYLDSQDNHAALNLILGGVNHDTPAYSIHRSPQDDLLQLQQARQDAEHHAADDYADVPFSRKPVDAQPLPARALTHQEMIARGSGGSLSRGYERYIPIDKLDGLEPVPSNNESPDGKYHLGRSVTDPIETKYDAGNDVYMVHAGNHRIAQAKANGQTHIRAFVEPDGHSIGSHAVRDNPNAEPKFSFGGARAAADPYANNASGESSASLEAISRQRDEKAQGQTRLLIDRDGSVRPLLGVDAVDTHARPGQVIVQRGVGRDPWTAISADPSMGKERVAGKINAARATLDAEHAELQGEPAFSRDAGEGQQPTDTGVPSTHPTGPGADHADLATIAKYNRVLSRYIGADVHLAPATAVPEHAAAALAGIDRLLGGRTLLVANHDTGAIDFDGVTLQDGTRLIDERATAPLVTVTLHETFHQMEKDDPDLAGQVHDYIRQHGATHAYHAVLQDRAASNGEDPSRIGHDRAVSELSADAVADAMSDPVFLEGMAKRNPGLFRQVADAIMASLNRVLKHLRRTLGSSSYLDDVAAFRDHLAGIMAKYADRVQARSRGEAAPEGEATEPAFSREAGDLPSRKEVIDTLREHPFTKGLVPKGADVSVVGSFAHGAQTAHSDIDVVVHVKSGADELQAKYRHRGADYFMRNGLTGVHEDVHPQWNGRRIDVYFSDRADGGAEGRPIKPLSDEASFSRKPTDDQTQTPAFQRWFGDSKVVDAEGKPLVVYHSTTFGDFDTFNKAAQAKGMAGYGFYFSDMDGANIYADYGMNFQASYDWQGNPKRTNVMPVYLAMQHPLLADNIASVSARFGKADPGAFGVGRKYGGMDESAKTAIQRAGYDGVIAHEYVKRQRDGSYKVVEPDAKGAIKHPVYVVFEPGQIKSSIGNRGTFDPAEPSILFSRKPTAGSTDYLQDMPSRRPGEAQGDYLRRITRKNGAEIKAATALVKQQRQLGRYALRAMEATKARQMAIADAAMREARKTFDKTPKVINFASVHQWETGQPIVDPDFRHFVATMQGGFDQRVARIQALAPGSLQSLIEHYMPHLYEDSSKATKWYQNVTGKRPLAGDKSFLKQRTWPTLKEAIDSGLKPITDNPVDWVLAKYAQMDKFIGLLDLKQHMTERGWIIRQKAGDKLPDGYATVDDPSFRQTVKFIIEGNHTDPNLPEWEDKAAVSHYVFAMPELMAKDLNNLLGPGLEKYGIWRSLRAVQNTIVSSRLSISAFHAGFTSIDNAVTHAGVGLQRLAMGDIGGGLTALVKALPTMLTSPIEGGHLNAQWTGQKAADPHTAALLDLLTRGGARMQMGTSSAEYNNALPKVLRTFRQLQAPGMLADKADEAKRYTQAHGVAKAGLVGGWKTIQAAGSTLSAMGEAGSYLIHHWLVPNQKMAARVTLLKFELDRYAAKLGKQRGDYAGIIDVMNPDVAQQLASEITDKVDFRLGQMTYDNFFYPKIARQMAQLVLMAPGWLAGGIQTAAGGVVGLKSIVKPRPLVGPLDKAGTITDAHRGRFEGDTANLAMLFLMVGGAGALYQWLVSGIKPDSLKDFVAPRTGRKNADGSEERLVAPSYLKDHYELVKHPFATLAHKLNPSIGMLWELAHNADYFGDNIHDPHAATGQQIGEVARYLLKGMSPFTVDNVQKALDNGDSAGQMAANFVGVTNAAASLTRTPFQAFVAKGGEKGWAIPASTPEEAAYYKRLKSAEDAIRQNRPPDLSGLDPQDVRKIQRAVRIEKPESQFAKLGLADKLDAYQLATPAERRRYDLKRMLLANDPRHSVSFRRLPENEQRVLMDQLQTIARTPMEAVDD